MSDWALLGATGFLAGIINAVAGGGTLVTFPALLHAGLPSVTASATNTVAVWPGQVSSIFPYWRIIASERHRAWVLAIPAFLGGLLGSYVLLHTSQRLFDAIVPWLILFACALLLLQARVSRWMGRLGAAETDRHVPAALWIAMFLISVYGGYFGAGQGILILAGMAIFMPQRLQTANGLKILYSTTVNAIAALYFLLLGAARLPEAAVVGAFSIAGGVVGARLAQRLPAPLLRGAVVTYGTLFALKLLLWR